MRLPVLLAAVALALPATAAAAPPPNDHYLASTTIDAVRYADAVDTTEATTQSDLFDPNRDGLPYGGGEPEPTSCGGAGSYGRTAWWDFRPPTAGRVEIEADGGFDVVVAVYRWSRRTAELTGTVRCQNDEAGSETVVIPRVTARADYTIQVGGANGAGGPLDLSFVLHPDTDGDGTLDRAPDRCPRVPGLARLRGCPPTLGASPRISYATVAGGVRLTGLVLDGVPKGARATARCGRTVRQRARRAGTLAIRGCRGRTIADGTSLRLRVTLGRTGAGRYRYGAIGRAFRWPVSAGRLGPRESRCLPPGSRSASACR